MGIIQGQEEFTEIQYMYMYMYVCSNTLSTCSSLMHVHIMQFGRDRQRRPLDVAHCHSANSELQPQRDLDNNQS